MTATRLEKQAGITLDAGGTGSVTLGPARPTESWNVQRMTTKGNSTADPTLDVLRGSSSVLDSTPHGNDDVSDSVIPLLPGEFLTIRYTGGTPGATMTFYLEGTTTYT